ncbi:MAG: 4Fe-4S binding protein [Bacteroidales bacterium]|jgi:pyruvate ferredoxin oxidoreductase delta subunit|nr:4Fe-4S binding protein [Bacteroidales bacterium]
MNRPKVQKFIKPKHINDYPVGPQFTSGHLFEVNAGWRTFRPVLDNDICTNCLVCYMVCPDGVIFKSDNKVDIDYDYCKGCGVCANECKFDAIKMVKEEM